MLHSFIRQRLVVSIETRILCRIATIAALNVIEYLKKKKEKVLECLNVNPINFTNNDIIKCYRNKVLIYIKSRIVI